MKTWPINSEPTTWPDSSRARLPSAWRRRRARRTPVVSERVDEAGQDERDERGAESDAGFLFAWCTPQTRSERFEREIDELDARERRDDAADAVDEQ